ncbi:leucine-rich repeat-containing protein 51 isoform X2 [Hemicordylus capensis]|uniref:leucine-rich repeat-containing protein 51 isoform X2 n=1 Tax=Hemicordylus capensis TaxID=884348 RepID=UPI00230367BA|nr:leucine-rich repeat-containing protein 51 isoform X2 [Hemicordylus capensis]
MPCGASRRCPQRASVAMATSLPWVFQCVVGQKPAGARALEAAAEMAASAVSVPSTTAKMCAQWNYSKAALQAPPMDFSFRGISFMQDMLTEEPRPGLKPIKVTEEGRLLTQAVRLNNNTLSDLTDFTEILGKLLEYPEEIYWIDLSFNDLPIIDPVLTTFYNLRTLNLHGNSIQHLSEVDKLAILPNLRSLTLHGNPVEEEKGYSGVTKLDRSTASVWRRMNIKPKKVRRRPKDY